MLALPGATAELTGPGRGRWGRALTTAALAVTVCVGTAFTGLTPAHAGPYPSSTIPVGGNLTGVAFSPDGTQAYVTTTVTTLTPTGNAFGDYHNTYSGSVSVIQVATGTISKTITVGSQHTNGVAFSPDGAQAYVTSSSGGPEQNNTFTPYSNGSVSVIQVATGTVSKTISVGGSGANPTGVAFSPDGTQAYVTSGTGASGGGLVSVISVATGTVSRTILAGDYASGVAFSPDGTQAYVTTSSGPTDPVSVSVSVIKVATGTVSNTIPVGTMQLGSDDRDPTGVAFSPDGAQAYVTGAAGGVSVIKVATGTVSKVIPVYGLGVAFSPNGAQAYVAGGEVSVIQVATGTVSSTFQAGGGAVAFSPDGTKVYVAGGGSVSVILPLKPLVSMRLATSSASVQAGTAVRLTAEGYGSETQNSSSDLGPMNAIYTTDSNGVVSGSAVTFTKAGQHTITASFAGVTATATVLVTPAAMATFSISPSRMTVGIGDSIAFTTTGADRFGNPFDVTTKSVFVSDNETDLVRGNTVYFGPEFGERTITGTDGVFTATAMIKGQIVRPGVLPPPPARAPRRSTTKATAR